jgi:hypothetical protein
VTPAAIRFILIQDGRTAYAPKRTCIRQPFVVDDTLAESANCRTARRQHLHDFALASGENVSSAGLFATELASEMAGIRCIGLHRETTSKPKTQA